MLFKPTTALGAVLFACAIVVTACQTVAEERVGKSPSKVAVAQTTSGSASWYGADHHGRRTANGERFDMNAKTAAHRTLPFGTRVRVTNQRNGRQVVVRINDRGPFTRGRIIDVSRSAAQALGMVRSGTAPVTVEVLAGGA